MNKIQKYRLTLIGVFAGAFAGYFYCHFIGCTSGTCAITSQPANSTVYGAMMGGIVFNIFQKEKPKSQSK